MSSTLENIIYGKTKEEFDPHAFFEQKMDASTNVLLHTALQKDLISPDDCLIQAISLATSKEYILPIALCIKHGADTNMYVDYSEIGEIHILAFTAEIVKDQILATAILLMLLLKGAISGHPVFKNSDETVLEWLKRQNMKTILNKINIGDIATVQEIMDSGSSVYLSLILDLPELMPRDYEDKDILTAIEAFSNETLKYTPDVNHLFDAILCYNEEAFQLFLTKGHSPSYTMINEILLMMKGGNAVTFQILENMLLESIAAGYQVDNEQRLLISTLGEDLLENVLKEYKQPYWRKVCKYPATKLPFKLKRLAMALNMDSQADSSVICSDLDKISKANVDELKEAARKRQEDRLVATLGYNSEFISGKKPNLICRNTKLLPNDPFTYNDLDLAYYRDEGGVIWCFTSEMFQDALDSKTNPYDETSLSEKFLTEIGFKLDTLKKMGMINSISYNQAVDELTIDDVIDDKQTQYVLEQFLKHGDYLQDVTQEQMESAFIAIGYYVNLSPLTKKHAIITCAHAIHNLKPEEVDEFLSKLEGILHLSS